MAALHREDDYVTRSGHGEMISRRRAGANDRYPTNSATMPPVRRAIAPPPAASILQIRPIDTVSPAFGDVRVSRTNAQCDDHAASGREMPVGTTDQVFAASAWAG
jgi:hypothetical protein